MSVEKDPAVQVITDARALLDTLLTSGWQEMHVISGDAEIFLARGGGALNPMRAEVAEAVPAAIPPAAEAGQEMAVKASHVATLVDILPVGTAVTAGQSIATLRVLEACEALEAPLAGTIVRHEFSVGDLVDYGASLLSIAGAA